MPNKFAPKTEKICAYCGKSFMPTSSRQKYCKGPHYKKCVVCGKMYEINLNVQFGDTCSVACRTKKTAKTNREKYGADCVFQSKEIKDKIKETNLARYGVDHYSKTAEYREKYTKTCMEHFGTKTPLENAEVQAKQRKTNIAKYGGASPMQNDEIKQKAIDTCLSKFGTEYAMQNADIAEKTRQARISMFADTLPEDKRTAYLSFKADPKAYIDGLGYKPTMYELYNQFGYSDMSVVSADLIKYGLTDCVEHRYSVMEMEVRDFLLSICPDITIVMRDREVIGPKELDLYLPDFGIAIECNPTITHNSTSTLSTMLEGRTPLDVDYHKEKSDLCKKQGIFLFHIFGYEWAYKQSIIKSMLANLLGVTKRKIYARDTYVSVVRYNEATVFLNKNHRQGYMTSKVRLGLRIKGTDELVSLMTFNKPRKGIGKTSDDDLEWELGRFCNSLNTNVVGGASKLFKYFIKNYKYSKIVSFSDIAHTKGNLYDVLGFTAMSESSPGYVWVHMFNDLYLTRTACRKNNLRKLFNDPTIDIENKTEAMIMAEHGFVQVFDCGVIRWEFCKS